MENLIVRWLNWQFVKTVSGTRFMQLPVHIFTTVLVISVCSTAVGQNRHYSPSYNMMRRYLDQINKMDADQKKSSIAEAKQLLNQSDAIIKESSAKRSRLETELEAVKSDLKNCEKSIDKCDSARDEARKQRSNLETKLLASQPEQSPYRTALKQLQEAEEDSAKRAELVLKHPVKDGNPERLRPSLKKNEYKALEDDSEWVSTLRRFRAAKERLATEVKSLTSRDKAISDLDESISRMAEDRKQLKAELATTKTKKASLTASTQQTAEVLDAATNDRNAAQLLLSRLTGK